MRSRRDRGRRVAGQALLWGLGRTIALELPDLWGGGLEEELFLWLHVQHLNSTNDRLVYACPPRPYYVLAAYRLAKLVETLRSKQADVPITIVCHSQGNMVGMAAAFLGDRMDGGSGRCVADTYVMANPPYSLVESNGTENWTERHMEDPQGRRGRQTLQARTKTLAAFFNIIRGQASKQQDASCIDKRMSNVRHDFTATADRARYGLNGSTYGRVTLYCNPHDQVISASPVQGIGWRGMSAAEVIATGGGGVFTQRVFAQGFKVGQEVPNAYNYWSSQNLEPGCQDFWQPNSPRAEYSISKGVEANTNPLGEIMTVLTWPLFVAAMKVLGPRINALPPTPWVVQLEAPAVPTPFEPEAKRFGLSSPVFDQRYDAAGDSRDKHRAREAADAYAGDHVSEKDGHTDTAKGNAQSEAELQYEHHALLRMQAKREHRYANDAPVKEEESATASYSEDYEAWRSKKIKAELAKNIDTHATDHSTIMTNEMHARRALAYDVAVGCCDIAEKDLRQIRIAADWRFLSKFPYDDPNKEFAEYFKRGTYKREFPFVWAGAPGSQGAMPERIADERQMPGYSTKKTAP